MTDCTKITGKTLERSLVGTLIEHDQAALGVSLFVKATKHPIKPVAHQFESELHRVIRRASRFVDSGTKDPNAVCIGEQLQSLTECLLSI